jgi:hypothetical protein
LEKKFGQKLRFGRTKWPPNVLSQNGSLVIAPKGIQPPPGTRQVVLASRAGRPRGP